MLRGASAAAGAMLLPVAAHVQAAAASPRFAVGDSDFLLDGQAPADPLRRNALCPRAARVLDAPPARPSRRWA
jgi:hypothetical protein